MSYTEREAVLERFAKVDMDTYYGFTAAVQFGVDHAIQCIKETPAADVAPVRHGQWLPQIVLGEKAWDCSECKTLGSPHWKWCPACGALMDGEETPTCHDGVCEIPGIEQEDDYVE